MDAVYPYPFDEFVEHYRDNYQWVHADKSESMAGVVVHLFEYLGERCPDPEICRYKVARFMFIVQYVSHHIDDFDKGDLAVNGSKEVGALVSMYLLQAVHHFFTSAPISRLKEPSVDEVIALAETYRPAAVQ